MKRYTVIYDDEGLSVYDRIKDESKPYTFTSFVYGQWSYDYRTDNYPNYVHKAVWRIYGCVKLY